MSDGNGIVWEDPPSSKSPGRGLRGWRPRLLPLMERAGQWANMGDWAISTARALNCGALKRPAGRWEFTSRICKDNARRATLYARYLGPEESAG